VVIEYRTILGHQAELALTKLRDNVDFDTLQSALAVLAIARGELKLGAMIHLKDQKIFCSRSASVLEIPLVKSTERATAEAAGRRFLREALCIKQGSTCHGYIPAECHPFPLPQGALGERGR